MTISRLRPVQIHPDETWKRLFGALNREGQPLNVQIRRIIVGGIQTGVLGAHTRLPSTRQLASMLGIARNTVTAAYQLLIDESFLIARERSGIFVSAALSHITQPQQVTSLPNVWQNRFAILPSSMPQILKPRDWQNYPYPFLFGQYDPALFPTNNWREAVKTASSVKEIQSWAVDMVDDDDPDLVEQLRIQVLPRRGIFARPGEIIVTIGSQQALSMLVQLLVGRDTSVGVEEPGYPDVRNMVSLTTDRIERLACDDDGVLPGKALSRCHLAFVTVSHHCPTTAVMPLERRKALIAQAEQDDILFVEDDYEADLSVERDGDIPSLKSLDTAGRVIYVGSFSKVLAPGLRVGYIVAPRPVISELRVLRRLMLRHPPTNNQRALASFIALGHYRQHLQKTGEVMYQRAQRIAALLPEVLPNCRFRRGEGATSFWIEGPDGFNARDLIECAQRDGVLIEAGDIFFAEAEHHANVFRLGFSSITTHHIEPGLRRLGRAFAEVMAHQA